MRRLILSLFAVVLISATGMANNADLFTYNTDQVNKELAQIQSIEDYVSANPDVTLLDMQTTKNSLVSGLNLSINLMGSCSAQDGEEPLGISPFIWGCCFGIVGIAIVYFIMEDSAATKQALRGCIFGYLFSAVVYVVFYVWLYSYYGIYY